MANDGLNGVQKAAVLLITLGPERSADIFKHLKEDEIEELTLEIANTKSVSPEVKEMVLEEGDSVYFDATKQHGMQALNDKKAKFLAIII